MAKGNVIWTKTAAKQRRAILRYWTLKNKSSSYAEKLIVLINNQLKIIAKFPKIYVQSDFPNIRVSAMGNFSLYYKINEETIEVVAFWDNRQDPKKLIQILGKNDSG